MYLYFRALVSVVFSAQAREVPDAVFLVAARQLASLVPQDRLDVGAIYPDQSELRSVSACIAAAVVREVNRQGVGRAIPENSIADVGRRRNVVPGVLDLAWATSSSKFGRNRDGTSWVIHFARFVAFQQPIQSAAANTEGARAVRALLPPCRSYVSRIWCFVSVSKSTSPAPAKTGCDDA